MDSVARSDPDGFLHETFLACQTSQNVIKADMQDLFLTCNHEVSTGSCFCLFVVSSLDLGAVFESSVCENFCPITDMLSNDLQVCKFAD